VEFSRADNAPKADGILRDSGINLHRWSSNVPEKVTLIGSVAARVIALPIAGGVFHARSARMAA
jgi:hypothetical protein